MVYNDREDAGYVLSGLLRKLRFSSKNTVVFGIARGGVVVASAIASVLKFPLFVIVIKKIGAAYNRELAIGAVGTIGRAVLDKQLIGELGISGDYVKNEIVKMRTEAKAREKFLGKKLAKKDINKKNVLVVDDGLATGQTAKAAAIILRLLGAKRIVLAVPVASFGTVEILAGYFDKIVCPTKVTDFMAVGQFYKDFRPVSDEEVKTLFKVDSKVN